MKKLILLLLIVGCVTEPEDCAGVAGGTAELDNCNVCDTDKTNDCVPDCTGVWGGESVVDECGVCGGDGIADGACDCAGNVDDCAGECGGTAVVDECGVCYGDGSSCTFDIDGNVYETVQIGEQLWMAENLKVTHYNNGEEIPNITNNEDWVSLSTGAYGDYDNNPTNSETYGRLYNWYTVDDSRGLCMDGWHVPSDEEIMELEMELGMSEEDANSTGDRGTDEGSKLAGNSDLWYDGDLDNNSEFGTSGFDALPAGFRVASSGSYDGMGGAGDFWSSSEDSSYGAWGRGLHYNGSGVYRYYDFKHFGFSVRCLGD